MSSFKVLISCGTRPEIIKLAPVYIALRQRGVDATLAHTGQHRELADSAFAAFGIQPDCRAETCDRRSAATASGPDGGELMRLDAALLGRSQRILESTGPSLVVVQGDTSSALMMGWAAFHQRIPVAHVEAGLRTHRKHDPFPEEMNRVLLSQLADIHFAPTVQARSNLRREGIREESIHVVGNTVVDAQRLRHLGPAALELDDLSWQDAVARELFGRRLLLVTAHRRENQPSVIHQIAGEVRRVLDEDANLVVAWPLHPNPRVREAVESAFTGLAPQATRRCFLMNAVSYELFQWLLERCWVVLTDSGGVQEEAAILHRPALIFRECTERSELVDAGAARLVRPGNVSKWLDRLRADARSYEAMASAEHPYGDGHAAARISDVLCQ